MNNALSIVDLKDASVVDEQVSTSAAAGVVTSVQAAESTKLSGAPAGYIPIRLSTLGRVGAPALFHIRNFSTRDLMKISLTDEEDIPAQVLELLKDLVWEEDVDVETFHEEEIIETLVLLYSAFYNPVLQDVDFPWDESDIEELRRLNPADVEDQIAALRAGKWKPKTDIDIQTGVETYDLPEDFKPVAGIKSRQGDGFSCSFGLPKYGDVLVLKRWLRDNYGEQEKQFAKTVQLLKLREDMLTKFNAGEPIDLSRLPVVDSAEEAAYNRLQVSKAAALVDVIRGLHLRSFEGKDVSDLPLSERIKLVQDPRVDVTVAKKLDKYFSELKFGIKPDVLMHNPITGKPCVRRFSFRLIDILQAVQVFSADQYDIVFGG